MFDKREVKDAVLAGVHDVLPKAKIARVDVREKLNSIDEPILEIIVAFAKRNTVVFTGEEYFALDEAVRRRLPDLGEIRYPHLRYVGEKELKILAS